MHRQINDEARRIADNIAKLPKLLRKPAMLPVQGVMAITEGIVRLRHAFKLRRAGLSPRHPLPLGPEA
jgi:hypothetical protein